MKKGYIYAFAALLCLCAACGRKEASQVVEVIDIEESAAPALGFVPDSLDMRSGEVKNGQFFSTLLGGLGLSQQEAYNLTEATKEVFDVKTLRVGKQYRAYYKDSVLKYLVYDRDKASSIVFDCTAPYAAWVYEKPVSSRSAMSDNGYLLSPTACSDQGEVYLNY